MAQAMTRTSEVTSVSTTNATLSAEKCSIGERRIFYSPACVWLQGNCAAEFNANGSNFGLRLRQLTPVSRRPLTVRFCGTRICSVAGNGNRGPGVYFRREPQSAA